MAFPNSLPIAVKIGDVLKLYDIVIGAIGFKDIPEDFYSDDPEKLFTDLMGIRIAVFGKSNVQTPTFVGGTKECLYYALFDTAEDAAEFKLRYL